MAKVRYILKEGEAVVAHYGLKNVKEDYNTFEAEADKINDCNILVRKVIGTVFGPVIIFNNEYLEDMEAKNESKGNGKGNSGDINPEDSESEVDDADEGARAEDEEGDDSPVGDIEEDGQENTDEETQGIC